MLELDLQDLLADKLREVFHDYSLLSKSGELQNIQVLTQFLPQPQGITIRDKKRDNDIVPQGYQAEDIESIFPCILVVINGSDDSIERSLRRSQINVRLIIGTYDNSQDCQGYRDICNIVDKIRLEVLSPGFVLDERFRLSKELSSFKLADDNEYPYFFGIIECSFESAQTYNNYF